jgi:transposase
MTETTRGQECIAAEPTLYLALELGSTKWTLAFGTSPAAGPRIRTMPAGDLPQFEREIALARTRLGVPVTAAVRSCYEAGRDGFWLHRWLTSVGVINVVVDSSSIEVNRRARRAKTDRLDAGSLLQSLIRWTRGERVWSVVRVPTPEAEAARQVIREIETVRQDRMRVRNRLHAVLAIHGIREPLRGLSRRLETLQSGDGRPLLPVWRARLQRDLTQLQAIEARLRALRGARAEALATTDPQVGRVAQQLATLRGVGETGASICSAELFGSRTFRNGREVGALLGLVPVPYRSDERVQDQGISKAGHRQLRRVSIQLAWCWLRYQPTSALAQWFHTRFASGGARSRRIGIVAVARKLMVALWQFVAQGTLPAGAALKSV